MRPVLFRGAGRTRTPAARAGLTAKVTPSQLMLRSFGLPRTNLQANCLTMLFFSLTESREMTGM